MTNIYDLDYSLLGYILNYLLYGYLNEFRSPIRLLRNLREEFRKLRVVSKPFAKIIPYNFLVYLKPFRINPILNVRDIKYICGKLTKNVDYGCDVDNKRTVVSFLNPNGTVILIKRISTECCNDLKISYHKNPMNQIYFHCTVHYKDLIQNLYNRYIKQICESLGITQQIVTRTENILTEASINGINVLKVNSAAKFINLSRWVIINRLNNPHYSKLFMLGRHNEVVVTIIVKNIDPRLHNYLITDPYPGVKYKLMCSKPVMTRPE